jgi:AcrR family transcriptional regulator
MTCALHVLLPTDWSNTLRPFLPSQDRATFTAVTTAAPRPVGRPARYTPDELLAVVTTEFISRGYDATSMGDIARATGLTKSSIYHHVSGKEELLRLAVARAVDNLFAVLDEEPSLVGPALERLEHVVRRSAEVLVAQLPYVTLLLRVRGNTAAERWALDKRREFDTRLSALVQAAIDEGDARRDLDPRLVTRLLFGMVNSVVEWFRPGGATTSQDLADALVALAFHGLKES